MNDLTRATRRTVVDKLEYVKQFGAARIKSVVGEKVDNIMLELFDVIPIDEWQEIEAAREVYQLGLGRLKFDEILNRLIQKYRHDPPHHKLTML